VSWQPKRAIVRVLEPDGDTAGTAFFVAPDLLATCAHVLVGDDVDVEFGGVVVPARVVAQRAPEAEDLALLRVDGPGTPVVLAPLLDARRRHLSWGFPAVKAVEGMAATVTELAPATDAGIPALQARSEEVSFGFSGAPVWDDETDAVIGVVMGIAAGDPGGRQGTTFFVRPAEELWKLCPALRGTPENPYRGLEVFEAEHAALYFGRDRAIELLIDRLAADDFVAVVGPSGSGKSSLVRAGLEKGLADRPPLELEARRRIVFRPGTAPSLDLERATLALDGPAIVVVDQFERLFTDCADPAERRRFADALLALADPDVKVLLTLRADFYGEVLALPALGAAVAAGQVTVLPMTHDELLGAVIEPARARLRLLEPGLAEQLVDDVEGRPGDLPLLQLVLTRLWAAGAGSGMLDRATYEALGSHAADGEPLRVRGVIARLAEDFWRSLDVGEQAAATRLLLGLAAPGGVSRRVWRLEADRAMQAVADRLVDARLLTSGTDAATGRPTIEVAHEALISAWPRLHRLATRHEEFIRFYDTDLAPFLRHGGMLLRGEALKRAEGWLATAPELLSRPAADFIAASARRREDELEAELERRRAVRLSESLRLAAEARAALDAQPDVALLVASEAMDRDHNGISEAVFRDALARLPAEVLILRPAGSPAADVGVLADGTIFSASPLHGEIELWTAEGEPTAKCVLPAGAGISAAAVGSRVLALRGSRLYLIRRDGTIVAELELPGPQFARTLSLAVDGDDGLVYEGERCSLVHVGADVLELVRTLRLVAESEDDATRHPAGRRLRDVQLGELILSVTDDDVRVWSRGGDPWGRIEVAGVPASVCQLAGGRVLVAESSGGWVTWHDGIKTSFRDADSKPAVEILAIDRAADRVVTRAGSVVELRDRSGALVAELLGDARTAAVAAGPRRVATGDDSGTVRIFDGREGAPVAALFGHADMVVSIAFLPADPEVAVSADNDGEVRLWRLGRPAVPRFAERTRPMSLRRSGDAVVAATDLDVTLDGRTIVGRVVAQQGSVIATVDDRRLRIARAGTAPLVLEADVPFVRAVAIAPTQTHVATFATPELNRDLRIWSLADGSAVRIGREEFPGRWSPSNSAALAFRADGARLAVAVEDGTGWIWTVGGERVGRFAFGPPDFGQAFELASDPLGELIAVSGRDRAVLCDWNGERVGELPVAGQMGTRVAFVPGGRCILTTAPSGEAGSGDVAELFTRDGERVARLATGLSDAWPLLDPHGRYVCLSDDAALVIFDVTTGARVGAIAGPLRATVESSDVSPDGELVAAAASDGIVRIWSWAERRIVSTFSVDDPRLLSFSPDGRELLCATRAEGIDRYPVDVADLLPAARARMPRPLTDAERARFGIVSL
jgi:WD40 repeat protein